jgi:hypothetical protein
MLYGTELPLLEHKDYLQQYLVACSKNPAASCKKVASANEDMKENVSSKSDVNIMLRGKRIPNERGSPSLVGRGIANPMSERTRGFEMSRGKS